MEARQEFYEVLKKRLLDKGLVKQVGLWNQDTEFFETDEVVDAPAVLVEYGPMEWSVLTGGSMKTDVEVRLHILTVWNSESDDKTAWRLSQSIMRLMALLKEQSAGDSFAVLRPVATLTNGSHGNILESIDTYMVRFYAEFRP